MEYKLSRVAAHYIKSQDRPTRTRIKEGIEGLLKVPPEGDIKPMKGYKDEVYRLRVGGFRVVYEFRIADGVKYLYIKDVGARGDIYK